LREPQCLPRRIGAFPRERFQSRQPPRGAGRQVTRHLQAFLRRREPSPTRLHIFGHLQARRPDRVLELIDGLFALLASRYRARRRRQHAGGELLDRLDGVGEWSLRFATRNIRLQLLRPLAGAEPEPEQ
jgi:hypothetical protein